MQTLIKKIFFSSKLEIPVIAKTESVSKVEPDLDKRNTN